MRGSRQIGASSAPYVGLSGGTTVRSARNASRPLLSRSETESSANSQHRLAHTVRRPSHRDDVLSGTFPEPSDVASRNKVMVCALLRGTVAANDATSKRRLDGRGIIR